MHTIWMREHNRVAKLLANYNPTWNDESIFQEARRIVIAEMQHITYNEYIPNLLSKRLHETNFTIWVNNDSRLTKVRQL